MQAIGGQVSVVLNGEIYNFRDLRKELMRTGHRFHTQSDTEVVLNGYIEWGVELFQHLSGAFAIGIYDGMRGRLVLGRDRFGEKPLYYHRKADSLMFGSELKSIICSPGFSRSVDLEALDSFLYVGFGPVDRSLMAGIRKLKPSHYSIFDLTNGAYREVSYWVPPILDPSRATRPREELMDELEERLEIAVLSQLMSDVPIGVLLSGGLDSSLITAMAARHQSPIRTFTVRFQDFPGFDETRHARLIARHFDTEHTDLDASSVKPDVLTKIVGKMDDPVADSSIIPTYLVCELVKKHCSVALGGDGGDELFGGYPRYSKLLKMQQRLRPIPSALRRATSQALLDHLPSGFRGTNYIQLAGINYGKPTPVMNVLFSRRHRIQLFPALRALPVRAESHGAIDSPKAADLVDTAIRHDLLTYLPEDILVKVDRASMMNSLEVRAPFLDVAVAEFAMSQINTKFKTSFSDGKVILKDLSRRVLPAEFDVDRKQGFSVPLGDWLKTDLDWINFMRSALFDTHSSLAHNKGMRGIWEGLLAGRANAERIFALVTLSLWFEAYEVTPPR